MCAMTDINWIDNFFPHFSLYEKARIRPFVNKTISALCFSIKIKWDINININKQWNINQNYRICNLCHTMQFSGWLKISSLSNYPNFNSGYFEFHDTCLMQTSARKLLSIKNNFFDLRLMWVQAKSHGNSFCQTPLMFVGLIQFAHMQTQHI